MGWPLLVLSFGLAIAAPTACFFFWNAIRGPVALRFAGRFGLIVMCQLTALLAVGVQVNRSFEFFASWDDLAGAEQNPAGEIHQAGGQPEPGAEAKGPGKHGFHFEPRTKTYVTSITGKQSGVHGTVHVWLPPQYNDPAYAHSKFPVIELLPGFPGQPSTWFRAMQGATMLDKAIRAGQAKPYILVAPTMTPQPGRDTECTDIPDGPKAATWLSQDVHELVVNAYRALPGADAWGTMGFSTGGFCAAKLALQYPDRFSAGVSLAGYFIPTSPDIVRDPTLMQHNSPLELINKKPAHTSLLLTASDQDPNTVPAINAMVQAARPPTQVFTYVVPRGGHNVGVWISMEPKAYEWLSQRLVGPA